MRPHRWLVTAILGLLLGCGSESELYEPPTPQGTVDAALSSEDPYVRAEALRLLALSDHDALLRPVQTALNDPSPVVQLASLEALLVAGAPEADELALARMASGNPQIRAMLVELIVQAGSNSLRQQALTLAIRDGDPFVRLAALNAFDSPGQTLSNESLRQLSESNDMQLAEHAFRQWAHHAPDDALSFVFEALRSEQVDERLAGLRLASFYAVPDLWPTMRAFVRSEDPRQRELAYVVLGYLGDPTAEEPLRAEILGGDAESAARALRAIVHIPGERPRNQPLIQANDPRVDVRLAAVEALGNVGAPPEDFREFLDDEAIIAEQAFREMLLTSAAGAIVEFERALLLMDDPVEVLLALERISRSEDITPLLETGRGRFEELVRSDNDEVGYLATRLMLQVSSLEEVRDLVLEGAGDYALYAVLEEAIAHPQGMSRLFEQAFASDLLLVRTAAAVGILTLGDAYQPSAAAP